MTANETILISKLEVALKFLADYQAGKPTELRAVDDFMVSARKTIKRVEKK